MNPEVDLPFFLRTAGLNDSDRVRLVPDEEELQKGFQSYLGKRIQEAVEAGFVLDGHAGTGERHGAVGQARHHAVGEVLLDGDVLLEQRVARAAH